MNAKWLSDTLDRSLQENPNWKINDRCIKVVGKWNTKVSIFKAHKARVMILD